MGSIPMFRYTEQKLANEVIKIFRDIDPSLTARYHPGPQDIQFYDDAGDEKGGRVYLGNLYIQAKQLGFFERRNWLRTVIGEISDELLLNSDEFLASLKLRVRSRFEIDLREKIAAIRGSKVQYLKIKAGDLILELVSDREKTVAAVGPERLEKFEITLDEAFRHARATLTRATEPDQWTSVEPGIWISTAADDFDFARLVASAADAQLPFDETPIAYAPSHSTCVITNCEDEDILGRVVAIGRKASENQRHLSHLLWIRNAAGDWQEYRPEDDTPAAAIVAMAGLAEENQLYDDQKYYLEEVLENQEEDCFVASFMIYEDDNGPFTACAYTFDIPSYLPLTDRVAIIDPQLPEHGMYCVIPWQTFADVIGPASLVMMPDEYPPRFKLLPALTPEQKSAFRALADPSDD